MAVTKIKGKDVGLCFSNGDEDPKPVAGLQSCSIRLTTVFDEEKTKADASQKKRFKYVEISGSMNGKVEAPSASELSMAELIAMVKSGKRSAADIHCGLYYDGAALVACDKVMFSGFTSDNPVGGAATWSVNFKGYSKVYVPEA